MFELFRLSARISFERAPCISNIDDYFCRGSDALFTDLSNLHVSCLPLLDTAFHMLLNFSYWISWRLEHKTFGGRLLLLLLFILAGNRDIFFFLPLLWPLLHTKRAFGELNFNSPDAYYFFFFPDEWERGKGGIGCRITDASGSKVVSSLGWVSNKRCIYSSFASKQSSFCQYGITDGFPALIPSHLWRSPFSATMGQKLSWDSVRLRSGRQ